MKKFLVLLLVSGFAFAGDPVKIYETDKYGNRKQVAVIRDNKVYPTDKTGNASIFSSHVIEGNKMIQTDKYGNRIYGREIKVEK